MARHAASAVSGQRLTRQLSAVDESTPLRRARPAGVLGAEVWVKLVDADQPAPTDLAALVFLTRTTKPPFRAEFKPGDGGKTAVSMTRWVNTQGEKGPWSEIAMATVAGKEPGTGAGEKSFSTPCKCNCVAPTLIENTFSGWLTR